MEKNLFAWSSGKDSAMAYHVLQQLKEYTVVSLLTTITDDYDRVSMHGVRRVLVEKQAEAMECPLQIVRIPKDCDNEEYESLMTACLEKYKQHGVSGVAFGDIFLEDIRKYRETNLAKIGMQAVFPIWTKNTKDLAASFVSSRFRAVITCVDTKQLDASFCGREYGKEFLADLPAAVDPCGENGEFHSFVYEGPIFKGKIEFQKGEIVLRDNRFSFCDLIPG
jgi:uncharacterized protein (TIGR00290 family)